MCEEVKRCGRCGCFKKTNEFSKNKNKKDGLQERCKSCVNQHAAERKDATAEYKRSYHAENKERLCEKGKVYYLENKEKVTLANKKYRAENYEECLDRMRRYYKNNRDVISTKSREYQLKNKEKLSAYLRSYYAKNKESIKINGKIYAEKNKEKLRYSAKKYREKNKEIILEKKKEWQKNKRKSDKLFAIKLRARCLVRQGLRRKGFTSKSRTYEILGCSYEFFFNYIKSLFLDGMTFENMSDWDIDHIIPVSSANSEDEIIALNHYTNLRPLWRKDNMKKGDKMPHPSLQNTVNTRYAKANKLKLNQLKLEE